MVADIPIAYEFTAASLLDLIVGKIEIIWHAGFIAPSQCAAVIPAIIQACEASHYTLTDDLQSLGTSIGEATDSSENECRYLQTAPNTISLIRHSIFHGAHFPGDTIRLLADEFWPHGATVGKYNGLMMLPGIVRRWPRGGHANPHIDQCDVPLLAHYTLTKRIGVNVYIEVPSAGHGGEIEFWGKVTNEEEYLARKRDDYGLDRDSLDAPQCSILPQQGDLLIFDAARIHGVRTVTDGSRITAACFMGVQAMSEPLVFFA